MKNTVSLVGFVGNNPEVPATQSGASITKGAMIMVTGRIHYTRWTDNEGQTRYGCEIIAEQVDFLAKAKEATSDEPKKRRSK